LVPDCAELLPLFFDDPDQPVRRAASTFLRQDDVLGNQAVAALSVRFIRTQAFQDDPREILEALRRHRGSLVPMAMVVFAVCDLFAGPLAGGTRDIREAHAYDITLVPPLLLRLYEEAEQTAHRDLQVRCLDSWDNLLKARVGGIRELMHSLDGGR
jgi:hypothetical protein